MASVVKDEEVKEGEELTKLSSELQALVLSELNCVAGSDGSVIYGRTSASNLRNMLSISRPTHDYYCSDPLFENAFNSKMNFPTSNPTIFLN
jgi:hypothetical protein